MTSPKSKTTLEHLLQQASWIRGLAGRLVNDPNSAEDLSQETWLRALSTSPQLGQSPRPWLATVMRNSLRQRSRGDGRRRRREEQHSPAEASPAQEDLIERVEIQRTVSEAVLELSDPYRSVILLRYFEGLLPRQIADRNGIAISTVNTQLSRAIDQLRCKLDARHKRQSWLLALLPLVEPKPVHSMPTIGAVLMKLKITAILVAVCAGGWMALAPTKPSSKAAIAPPAKGTAAPSTREASLPAQTQASPQRGATRIQAPALAKTIESAPKPDGALATLSPVILEGRVIDVNGLPVPNIEVVRDKRAASSPGLDATASDSATLEDIWKLVQTDGAGQFEIHITQQDLPIQLEVRDDYYTTVLSTMVQGGTEPSELTLVVARGVALEGRTVDEFGTPLQGVSLSASLNEEFRSRLPMVLDSSPSVRFATTSEADGSFSMLGVPAVKGLVLNASLEGYRDCKLTDPTQGNHARTLVLPSTDSLANVLRGRVTTAAGVAVDGAHVALKFDTTRTQEDGLFALQMDSESGKNYSMFGQNRSELDTLVATARGHLPGLFQAERDSDGNVQWPSFIELTLGGEPLQLSGRVLDSNGEPRSGIQVWIGDPTLFGVIDGETSFSENLQSRQDMGPNSMWQYVRTDERGWFAIDGLADRAYQLEAMDPATLLRVQSAPIQAGENNVELILPTADVFPSLRGKVVDSHGRGVPDVQIEISCDAMRATYREGSYATRHATASAGAALSQADGSFELTNVPLRLAYLTLNGSGIIPLSYGRDVELEDLVQGKPTELEILVQRRCHMQVELADPAEATSIALLDEHGERLIIHWIQGGRTRSMRQFSLQNGRTGALAVSDAGRTLVLYRGTSEVRRVPVELIAGELVLLQP